MQEKIVDKTERKEKILIPRWYAVYTRSRHEKRAKTFLDKKGIETYLPLVKTLKQWSDRKKWINEPLIKSYLFVRIPLTQIVPVLESYGVVSIVKFQGVYAPIPDFQIEAIRKTLESGYSLLPSQHYRLGDWVEVREGALSGVKGTIIRIENETKFILSIDGIKAAFQVQINPGLLKRIKPPG